MTSKAEDFRNASRLKVITMDYDFIPEYEIKMVAGRTFQRGIGNDEREAYVINLAGVKELGFSSPEEALGKSFMAHYHRLSLILQIPCVMNKKGNSHKKLSRLSLLGQEILCQPE